MKLRPWRTGTRSGGATHQGLKAQVWVLVGGLLIVLAGLAAAVAWRVHALPARHADALLGQLAAEHEAMWASVWGSVPARKNNSRAGGRAGDRAGERTEGSSSYASWSWSLWPRPQVHLMDVRWSVPAELSSSGQLHLERLTLGLGWASLWSDTPQLHEVRAQGLAGGSRHGPWGLVSEWQVREARLGPVAEGGVRSVSWTLASSLRAVRPAVPEPAIDPTPPWLAGEWTGQARWHPARQNEPAHWQQVDLRFQGELAGQVVPSARLKLARWQHQAAQERLAWDDLVFELQLGEGAQAGQLALRSAALDLSPDSASGQGWSGSWTSTAPMPMSWQLDSAAPRGRYTAVTWPRWRLVPSGREGSLAGGQLQADLSWFPDRRSLRWDALLAELSLQPRGQAERQWSLRGQLELGARASSWQLEGQAHGGAPETVAWDGPFATEGEWRRWPQAQADVRLSLASLWPERLWAAGSASAERPQQPAAQPVPQLVPKVWSRLASAPGELRLQVGQLAWRDLRLSGVEAQLVQQGETVQMPALSARLWGGDLSAQGAWQRSDNSWRLSARSRDAELGLLRQTLDLAPRSSAASPLAVPPPSPSLLSRQPDAAQGRWSGTTTLSGRGDDVRQWQGSWSVDVAAGRWQGLDLRAARDAARASPREVGATPPPAALASDQTAWRRLQASGKLDGGVAQLDRFALVGSGWRMAAQGTLNLQDGTLALDWSDGVGERLRGPVLHMSGPWRTPRIQQP